MVDKVTEIGTFVTVERHEHAQKERRSELRREADRVDRLRLDHEELRRIVIGVDGRNGLKSTVALHGALLSRIERLLWASGAVVLAGVAWFARGGFTP